MYFCPLSALKGFAHFSQLKIVTCTNCHQSSPLINHGFVYKQRLQGQSLLVGKRLFCSNRGHRCGCGTTQRLYALNAMPGYHFTTQTLCQFLLKLLHGHAVASAYCQLTGTTDPRNAWRWLNKLQSCLPQHRHYLNNTDKSHLSTTHHLPKRRQLLYHVIQKLYDDLGEDFGCIYQLKCQKSFM